MTSAPPPSPQTGQTAPGCPRCSAPLVLGTPACGACGLRLVGDDAAELWSLDQQLAALTARRGELLAALAAPLPPGSAQRTPRPTPPPVVVAPPPPPPPPPSGAPPVPTAAPPVWPAPAPVSPPRQRRFGAQQLLLVSGVLLVAIGALAGTAYVWDVVGPLGQAAVLVAVCAAAAWAARATARRRLGASAEALAVLSALVLLVLVGSARSLDVLGLAAVDSDAYRCTGLLLVIALAGAADRWLRPGASPTGWAWAAVLLTAAVPSTLVLAVDGELLTWAAAALTLAVLSVPAAPLLTRRARGLRPAGLVIGAAHLVLGVLALLVVDVDAGTGAWDPAGAAAEFALLAVAAGFLATRCGRPVDGPADPADPADPVGPAGGGGRVSLLAGRPATRRVAVVVAYGGVVGALVSLAVAGGAFAMLLLAFGIAATVALLLLLRPGLLPWPVLVSALALAGCSLLSEPVVGATEGTWWRPAAWYAVASAALLAGQRRPVPGTRFPAATTGAVAATSKSVQTLQLPRACWALAAAFAVLGGSLLAPAPLTGVAAVLTAVGAASVLLGLSALVRGAPEWVLVGGWAVTMFGAVVNASDGPLGAAVPLAVAGLGALLRAGARHRTAWVVPGVLLLAVAWWNETDTVAPPGAGVEWWSLPPALLALGVGVLAWQRHPALGSWSVLGAGLAGGLLPSAFQGAVEGAFLGSGWRVAAVALTGTAVCAAGVRWGWQAPVVLGAVAALLVAVGQLGPYALLTPAWVGLFIAGAVVLVVGVRIEQTRRDAARAVGWVRALR